MGKKVGKGSKGKVYRGTRPAVKKTQVKTPAKRIVKPVAPEPIDEKLLAPIRFGFVRGASPEKWAQRWKTRHPKAPLTMEALDETPLLSADGQEILQAGGVLLVRGTSAATTADLSRVTEQTELGECHAVLLYTEDVGLIAEKEADIATLKKIDDLEILNLEKILQHPAHDTAWPAPEEWADPAWEPATAADAASLVATGLGHILAPLPLARHIAGRKEHKVIPIADECKLPGTKIFAVWLRAHNSDVMQELVGVFRGRTANSSR